MIPRRPQEEVFGTRGKWRGTGGKTTRYKRYNDRGNRKTERRGKVKGYKRKMTERKRKVKGNPGTRFQEFCRTGASVSGPTISFSKARNPKTELVGAQNEMLAVFGKAF